MRTACRLGLVLVCALLLPGLARGDGRIRVLRDIVVEKGESAGSVVCFACAVRVKGTTSDIVTMWAGVDVEGAPSGDIVTLGGGVHLRPGAKVDGDVVALGGPVVIEPGASITGEVEAYPYSHFPGQRQVYWQGLAGLTGFNLLLTLLAYVLVRRRRVENMASMLRARPAASFVVGLIFIAVGVGLYSLPGLSERVEGFVDIATTLLLATPFAAGFIGICSLLGSSVRLGGRAPECGTLLAAICGMIGVTILLSIPLAGLLALFLLLTFAMGVALLSRFGARAPMEMPA